MTKFYVNLKTNCGTTRIGVYKTIKAAVAAGVNEVKKSHSDEASMAKTALSTRGYYCMGYSDREVCIEEENVD